MRGSGRARILAVLPDHPYPLNMGSRVRNLSILQLLSAEFELAIVTLVHDRAHLTDPGPVASLGRWIPVLASHRRGAVPLLYWHARGKIAGMAQGLHRETFFQSLPVLARAVKAQLAEWKPDLVHAAYWYALRRLAPFPRPPVWVVDTHDVQFERHARLFHRRSLREQRAELAQLVRYDRIVAITARDRETLTRSLPTGAPPIEVIGMGLDLDEWRADAVSPALPPAPRVAFYGNLSTGVNERGALHFLEEILPALRRRMGTVEGLILGADPSDRLRQSAAACGVRLTGYLPDVRPWLLSAQVLALCIPSGTGQRGRVVEALALGVPVVGYRQALLGLECDEGEGISAVDTPAEMEDRIVGLLVHPEKLRALGAAGRAKVESSYGTDATYGRFPRLYRSLLAQREDPRTSAPGPH